MTDAKLTLRDESVIRLWEEMRDYHDRHSQLVDAIIDQCDGLGVTLSQSCSCGSRILPVTAAFLECTAHIRLQLVVLGVRRDIADSTVRVPLNLHECPV